MEIDAYPLSIQFIAQAINEYESREEGLVMPARWLTLRDDLRYKYLMQAKDMVDQWWQEEQIARDERDGNPNATK
jgi:hypothetical protein